MASRAAATLCSSLTRRARSPSGCGIVDTGQRRRAAFVAAVLAGGRRRRAPVPARYTGQVRRRRGGRLAHCEQAASTPLRPRIRSGGQGAARAPAAPAVRGRGGRRGQRSEAGRLGRPVPGREGSQRVEYHFGARARQVIGGERAATPTARAAKPAPRRPCRAGCRRHRRPPSGGAAPPPPLRAVTRVNSSSGAQPGGLQARPGDTGCLAVMMTARCPAARTAASASCAPGSTVVIGSANRR